MGQFGMQYDEFSTLLTDVSTQLNSGTLAILSPMTQKHISMHTQYPGTEILFTQAQDTAMENYTTQLIAAQMELIEDLYDPDTMTQLAADLATITDTYYAHGLIQCAQVLSIPHDTINYTDIQTQATELIQKTVQAIYATTHNENDSTGERRNALITSMEEAHNAILTRTYFAYEQTLKDISYTLQQNSIHNREQLSIIKQEIQQFLTRSDTDSESYISQKLSLTNDLLTLLTQAVHSTVVTSITDTLDAL